MVSFAGVDLRAYGGLQNGDVWLNLDAVYEDGVTTVGLDVRLGDIDGVCDLPFSSATTFASWTFCCADVTFLTMFTCAGFNQAVVFVSDIMVPTLPWLSFDAQLAFTLGVEGNGGKTLFLSPEFDFGDTVCFDVYLDVEHTVGSAPAQTMEFSAIEVEGLGIVCDIAGVTFEATSYWGDPRLVLYTDWDGNENAAYDFPGVLRGYNQEYWEGYRITTTDDGCCGPFWFSIAALFKTGVIDQLFDVDLFDALMRIDMSQHFTFTTGLKIHAAAGVKAWTIGFVVTWGEAPVEEDDTT